MESLTDQRLERNCPMAGKEEKEKQLVGPFLEVLHLWSSNAGIRAQTEANFAKARRRKSGLVAEKPILTIKINETAGKTFEGTSVNTDPFYGNKCGDKKCVPSRNSKNKISCRKNDTYAIES